MFPQEILESQDYFLTWSKEQTITSPLRRNACFSGKTIKNLSTGLVHLSEFENKIQLIFPHFRMFWPTSSQQHLTPSLYGLHLYTQGVSLDTRVGQWIQRAALHTCQESPSALRRNLVFCPNAPVSKMVQLKVAWGPITSWFYCLLTYF